MGSVERRHAGSVFAAELIERLAPLRWRDTGRRRYASCRTAARTSSSDAFLFMTVDQRLHNSAGSFGLRRRTRNGGRDRIRRVGTRAVEQKQDIRFQCDFKQGGLFRSVLLRQFAANALSLNASR